MNIRYKELINFNKNIQLDNYNNLVNQLGSLVRGANIKPDGTKHYPEIIFDDIEIASETDEEAEFISVGRDGSVSTGMIGHTSNINPSYNSNTFIGPGLGTWTNIRTGEFFICVDKTIDSNIWIGQLGTRVTPPNLTIDLVSSDGLLYHFPLDAVKGSKVLDSVNGYIATKKSTSLKDGMISKCLYFKGNSYMYLDNPDAFDFSKDFTMIYRAYPKEFGYTQHHFHKSRQKELSILQEADGRLSVYFGNGTDYRKVTTTTTLVAEAWNKISIRRQGLMVYFYIDGQIKNTSTTHFGNPAALISNDDIASDYSYAYYGYGDLGYYKGYLDEIYMFDRVTSNTEIELVHNVGIENE